MAINCGAGVPPADSLNTDRVERLHARYLQAGRLHHNSVFCTALLLSCLAAGAVDDPIVLKPTQDVTIYSANAAAQWPGEGARGTMDLQAKSGDAHRILIYFELKKEAKTPCTTAMLHLEADEIWPNKVKPALRIQRLLRPFSESSASWGLAAEGEPWSNLGGDFEPVVSCARRLGREQGKSQHLDIDVTPLVQGWQNKQYPNYGMLLTLEDGSEAYARFFSKESENAPTLNLYYAATAPKNPDSIKVEQLQPLGKKPEFNVEITTTNFDAALNKELKVPFKAKSGLGPYLWKFTDLPAGLIGTADGNLCGTPTKAGAFALTVEATDVEHRSARKKVTVTVGDGAPKVDANPIPVAAKPAPKKRPQDDE